ncbi:hypothetical protein ScPMuIL_012231 [Solemya velum]
MFRTSNPDPRTSLSLSNTGVYAEMDIPVNSIAGPYPGEFQIGLHITDVQTTKQYLEVGHEGGKIVRKTGTPLQWLWYVQPARDCHEQNAEAYRDKENKVYIRSIRHIASHEQLLVWYRDDFARAIGIPALTLRNIKGKQQYVCNKCEKSYSYPNTLKAHLRFRCPESREEILKQLQETASPDVPIFRYNHSKGCTDCANFKHDQSYCAAVNPKLISKCRPKYCCLQQSYVAPKTNSAFHGIHPTYNNNLLCRCTPNVDFTRLDVSLQYMSGDRHRLRLEPVTTNCVYKPGMQSSGERTSGTTTHVHNTRGCYCDSISKAVLAQIRPYSCPSDRELHRSQIQPDRVMGGENPNSGIGNQFHLSLTLPTSNEPELLESVNSRVCIDNTRKGHLCLYCGKFYSRKYGLKIHLRTHTGYKPLKCKFCLRPFGDPSNLNKHIRLHAEGDTPYRCEYCGKVLVRRRDLERHVKSRHPPNVCEETESFIKEESPSRAENAEAEQADDITIPVDEIV